jgi:hypothetical protein
MILSQTATKTLFFALEPATSHFVQTKASFDHWMAFLRAISTLVTVSWKLSLAQRRRRSAICTEVLAGAKNSKHIGIDGLNRRQGEVDPQST